MKNTELDILMYSKYHKTISYSHDESVSREPPGAPPNTRAPSPQPQASGTTATETRLPYADPVPDDCKEMASPWIEVKISLCTLVRFLNCP